MENLASTGIRSPDLPARSESLLNGTIFQNNIIPRESSLLNFKSLCPNLIARKGTGKLE